MGMVEVYNAIENYLTPTNSNITYLGAVYPALPKVSDESDLFAFVPPGTGVGAVMYTFVESREETRIALGGPHNGRKFRPYTLSLLCIFKSDLPTSAAGQAAFNVFIDSLTQSIENNRIANAPGVIFSWGEGGINGGPDIRFEFPVPKTAKGGVMLFQAVCRITVVEIIDQ